MDLQKGSSLGEGAYDLGGFRVGNECAFQQSLVLSKTSWWSIDFRFFPVHRFQCGVDWLNTGHGNVQEDQARRDQKANHKD